MMGAPDGTPDRSRRHVPVHRHRGVDAARAAVGSAAWATLVARHDELLAAAIEGARRRRRQDRGRRVLRGVRATRSIARSRRGRGAARGRRRGVGRRRGDPGPDGPPPRRGPAARRRAAPATPEDYVGIDVNYAARIAARRQRRPDRAVARRSSTPCPPTCRRSRASARRRARRRGPARRQGLRRAAARSTGWSSRAPPTTPRPPPDDRCAVQPAGRGDRARRPRRRACDGPGDELAASRDRDPDRARRQRQDAARARRSPGPCATGSRTATWFVDLAAVRDPACSSRRSRPRSGSASRPSRTRRRGAPRSTSASGPACSSSTTSSSCSRPAPRSSPASSAARPALRLLVTSRELLRIAGERGHPVPPLEVEAGVALFVDRARAHRPGPRPRRATAMAAIRAICERLGGLPLAIELAAARVRLLAPGADPRAARASLDLGGGARDLPERQRTLRGAIAWSHELLSDAGAPAVRAGSACSPAAGRPSAARAGRGPRRRPRDRRRRGPRVARRQEPRSGSSQPERPPRRRGAPLRPAPAAARVRARAARGERRAARRSRRRSPRCASDIADDGRRRGSSARPARPAPPAGPRGAQPPRRRRLVARARASPRSACGSSSAIWRWFQQRGRLREGRALLDAAARARAGPATRGCGSRGWRPTAASPTGWTTSRPPARPTRSASRSPSRPAIPSSMADAHYDLGFLVDGRPATRPLREHEQRALELYTRGRRRGRGAPGPPGARARPCSWPATTRRRATLEDREPRRRSGERGSRVPGRRQPDAPVGGQLAARRDPSRRGSGRPTACAASPRRDSASGLARALGMAAIILLSDGDPELGARIAGATYRLVREKGVMLAPVKVLHLPGPGGARERAPRRRAGGESCSPRATRSRSRTSVATRVRDPGALARLSAGQAPEGTRAG